MNVAIDSFGTTDQGKVRANNQDNFLIVDIRKSIDILYSSLSKETLADRLKGNSGYLFAVADGVGGGPGGDHASETAIATLLRYASHTIGCFNAVSPAKENDLLEKLEDTVRGVHEALHASSDGTPGNGPATTLTMMLLVWPRAYLVHVGDSRAYVKRGDRVQRLTRDQTFGNYMVSIGAWTDEQAAVAKPGAILSSAVGGPELIPVVGLIDLQPGDSLMLCTDGLTRYADDELITTVLNQNENAETMCGKLVGHALEGGGRDNIAVIVVRTMPA
ncbi:MAG: protein phosphatase 2C domain-containing protein [Gemmatimonadales bacterium]